MDNKHSSCNPVYLIDSSFSAIWYFATMKRSNHVHNNPDHLDAVRNGEGILGEYLDFKRYLELTSVDVFDQLKTAKEKRIKTLGL